MPSRHVSLPCYSDLGTNVNIPSPAAPPHTQVVLSLNAVPPIQVVVSSPVCRRHPDLTHLYRAMVVSPYCGAPAPIGSASVAGPASCFGLPAAALAARRAARNQRRRQGRGPSRQGRRVRLGGGCRRRDGGYRSGAAAAAAAAGPAYGRQSRESSAAAASVSDPAVPSSSGRANSSTGSASSAATAAANCCEALQLVWHLPPAPPAAPPAAARWRRRCCGCPCCRAACSAESSSPAAPPRGCGVKWPFARSTVAAATRGPAACMARHAATVVSAFQAGARKQVCTCMPYAYARLSGRPARCGRTGLGTGVCIPPSMTGLGAPPAPRHLVHSRSRPRAVPPGARHPGVRQAGGSVRPAAAGALFEGLGRLLAGGGCYLLAGRW